VVIMMRWAVPVSLVMALGLGACSGGIPGLGGLGGGSSSGGTEPTQSSQGAGSTLRNFALYGGATQPPSQQPTDNERDLTCPSVTVSENGAAYRSGGGAASTVSYQASLINTARECAFQGNQVSIRVGVEGRLLLGTNGKPGTYTVPVRIQVKRRNDVVTQRFAQLKVTVPANETQAEFAHLEERITLPISATDPGDEYDVYVGFEAAGARAAQAGNRR
jgi:hypothetical protein